MVTIINLIKICHDWLFVETLDNEQRALLIISGVVTLGCIALIFGMIGGYYLLFQHLNGI